MLLFVDLSKEVDFSSAMTAVSMKRCIVFAPDIAFHHILPLTYISNFSDFVVILVDPSICSFHSWSITICIVLARVTLPCASATSNYADFMS